MKIIVAGPFQVGKSKYIAALDKKALNIMTLDKNDKECTIGMDIGSLECDGMKVLLFGTPGLLRFTAMRQIVTEGADGVIFLFDATDPDKDDAAIQILNEIRSHLPRNVPVVYAVNKIHEPDARSVERVRDQNYIPESAPIFGIDALTGENVEKPLDELLYRIKQQMGPLVDILRKYENNPLGLKTALDKNVDEIMLLLNLMEFRGIIAIDRQHMTYKVNDVAKFYV